MQHNQMIVTFILTLAYNVRKRPKMKKTSVKSPTTKRVAVPRMVKDENGNAILLCPFCKPTHPLNPSMPALCGTTLVLTAEQTIIRAKYNKDIVCVKCGEGGGEMVMFQNSYIHSHDCKPGVMAMTNPPKYSKIAEKIYAIKNDFIKNFIEKFIGRAMPVEEIDTKGKKTGVILGYFFWKPKKEVTNAKRTETPTG